MQGRSVNNQAKTLGDTAMVQIKDLVCITHANVSYKLDTSSIFLVLKHKRFSLQVQVSIWKANLHYFHTTTHRP